MNSYHAILIDNLSTLKQQGEITISLDSLIFQGEAGTKVKISLENLSLTVGGASNRIIFLTDKRTKNSTIYTTDKSLLKNEILRSHPAIFQQVNASKKTINRLKKSILIVCFSAIALCVGLYFSKDWMVKKLAQQIPTSWEAATGKKLFEVIKSEYTIIENDSLKLVFMHNAKPLLDEIKKEGVKIDLYFVKDPTINAFALPGGVVVIQTGLIENATSWEEVMGVLSHELAHVTQRHHLRGIINNMGLFAIISASFGDVSAIAGTIASVGGDLASLSNSRYFEIEADEVGWEYLNKAHIRPDGMISFFKILEKEHAKESTIDASFLSTHPATDDRIKKLSKKWNPSTMSYPLIKSDYNAFKQSLTQQ